MARGAAPAEVRSTPRPAEAGARSAEGGVKKSFVQKIAEGAKNLPSRDLLVRLRTLGKNGQRDQEGARTAENGHVLTDLREKADMAVLDGTKRRWEPQARAAPDPITGETATAMVRDEQVINDDFKALLANKDGHRATLENALRSAVDQDGDRILTDEEVAQKMQDEAWVKANSVKAVEKLVRAKMSVGKITEAEVKVIANTKWGADLAASMAEAAKDNPEVEAIVAQLKENTKKGLLESLKGEVNKKTLLALLMALLGAVAKTAIDSGGEELKKSTA